MFEREEETMSAVNEQALREAHVIAKARSDAWVCSNSWSEYVRRLDAALYYWSGVEVLVSTDS